MKCRAKLEEPDTGLLCYRMAYSEIVPSVFIHTLGTELPFVSIQQAASPTSYFVFQTLIELQIRKAGRVSSDRNCVLSQDSSTGGGSYLQKLQTKADIQWGRCFTISCRKWWDPSASQTLDQAQRPWPGCSAFAAMVPHGFGPCPDESRLCCREDFLLSRKLLLETFPANQSCCCRVSTQQSVLSRHSSLAWLLQEKSEKGRIQDSLWVWLGFFVWLCFFVVLFF